MDLFSENQVKPLVIDAKDHISGRLAAVTAKLLLNGQFVVVTNCSEIVKAGKLLRNVLTWGNWKKKTCNANPRNGPKHHRAPKAQFFRTVRGMVPRKKWRGLAALRRLKVYDGVPPQYFYTKKMTAPIAMASLRLKAENPRTTLGDLATAVGWTKYPLVKKFEDRRVANEEKINEHKKKICQIRENVVKDLQDNNAEFKKLCEQIDELEMSL